MTNFTNSSRRLAAFPASPKGDVLGTYETYDEALAVVDHRARVSPEFTARAQQALQRQPE